jgi:transposase
LVETREDTIKNIADYNCVNAGKLRRQYKYHSSNFKDWDQKAHAEDYMLFRENIGEFLSIDEVSLSDGELYTFVTNKNGRGKKGTLVASIKGTRTKDIVTVLDKLPSHLRDTVKEVTLDMARNMESAVRKAFPRATLVTDRFHVIRLALDSLQHQRVSHRWEEIDKENLAIAEAKKQGKKYKSEELANGDTGKQLLARCQYVLSKKPNEWTKDQKERADLLFERYPDLEIGYKIVLEFRSIYEINSRRHAEEMFSRWVERASVIKIKEFNTFIYTVINNFDNILNFFINRNTNANAESFNSKIKLFRSNMRGVSDTKFFLFRIHKLFA